MEDALMHYVVGLGNPGEQYQNTRHNVGWLVLDTWLAQTGLPTAYESAKLSSVVTEGLLKNVPVTVLYPQTFMNNSGSAVAKLVTPAEAGRLIVVYDDVDIPFGEIKISVGGGSGGHNGVSSITNKVGVNEFVRVRVGIAPRSFWSGQPKRPKGAKLPSFVLKPFTGSEQKHLAAVCSHAANALTTIVTEGVTTAMNTYN